VSSTAASQTGSSLPIDGQPARAHRAGRTAGTALALGALGIVFGDIGTSPLYAVPAVFTSDNHAVHLTRLNLYGVISLVFWSITMIVSVKYVSFIMRADNDGEGGIMALTALIQGGRMRRGAPVLALVTLGVLGACLFFGDGAITPAISVLSAVAGLKVAVPSLSSIVLPVTVGVLCVLFAIQQFGTRVVGSLFGPVMAVWFAVIGTAGAVEVAHHPGILDALSPIYGARFFLHDGKIAFFALGSVVLAVTGAEALYADMGHFGRGPIRRAWFFVVFPALTLNYLGQGSLLLRAPKTLSNPFFLLLPGWAQLPMVFLATIATVIASQAVISGAFSVSQQAVQLGFLPRMTIRHTSESMVGQVYVPAVNAILFFSVIVIVVGFGSPTALANAYGVAVTGTFFLTAVLFLAVARLLWHKPRGLIILGAATFLTIDGAFFLSSLSKVIHGGWLPLVMASGVFLVLLTWRQGSQIVTANRRKVEGPLRDFIEEVDWRGSPVREVSGMSVFLNPDQQTTPLALRVNVGLNGVLHERVIITCVEIERVPHVPESERVVLEPGILFSAATGDPLGPSADRFSRLTVRFGFLDQPDVPAAVRVAAERGLIDVRGNVDDAFYFLSRMSIVPNDAPVMSPWRKKLFVTMARNAADPAEYFRLPESRTVSMSGRVEL
jgi:KUP system potassium uptake protein